MSKTVKKLLTDVYKDQFSGMTQAMLVDIRGIEANDNNALRGGLAEKQIKITVVKNALAKSAFAGTDLEPLNEMIDGPSALVYGGESVVNVAREMIDWAKKLENLELKGAVLDGIVFGPEDITKLSKYPTRDEAQAEVVQLLLSPAKNLAGAIKSPGSKIASILKTIEEKLEAGETISKVA